MGKDSRTGIVASWLVMAALAVSACGGSGGGTPPADPPAEVDDAPPIVLFVESFDDPTNRDDGATDADWAEDEAGVVKGQAVTSRNAYVFGYRETWNNANSGRGQYVALTDMLVGPDQGVPPPGWPATSAGRRTLFTISDTILGDAGVITGIGWGPDGNQTVAASYGTVRIRLGYLAAGTGAPRQLTSQVATCYAAPPVLVYDGPYSVPQGTVANTPGHPTFEHVGGYPQNPGCSSSAGWNAQLYNFTGFQPWPAPTTLFDWTPGDPQVDDDSVLVVDVSVVEGSATQRVRSWFATTFPCSGILIGGYPEQRLSTTYEGTAANPVDNHAAGIVNPQPTIPDTCLTFSRRKSVAVSRFFAGAYGDDTDYRPAQLIPAAQTGGATVFVEYQGADRVMPDGVTIDTSQPFTEWVTDIDLCDGMRNLRYRLCLLSGLDSMQVARVERLTIPMGSSAP